MGMFCALITWASGPAAYVGYDFTTTPTGILATIDIDTEVGQLYSILRNPTLLSNDWFAVETDFPGTGSNEVFTDLTPLSSHAWFYKVTATTAPSANILINGDFEIGTPTDDRSPTFDCDPWVWFNLNDNNNAWLTDSVRDPIIGPDNQALEFRWGGTYIYQDFPVLADRDYRFECDSLQVSGNTKHVPTIQVEWYDASTNIIGSTIDVVSIDPTGTGTNAEVWVHMEGDETAPAGAEIGRMKLILNALSTGDRKNCYFDNAKVTLLPLVSSATATNWSMFSDATHADAAQYAGLYALADDTSLEVYKIDESVVDTVALSNINGMAFTASGRQLFIAAGNSVQAFNIGTGQLRTFVPDLAADSVAHLKGELFAGTASGDILRYAADLNDPTGVYSSTISVGEPVIGIAADIQEQMLYIASPSNLFRFDPTNAAPTQIASLPGIEAVSFGRTYGASGQGGLAILQNTGAERIIHLVPVAELQTGEPVEPVPYYSTIGALPDIGMTACGRILTAGTSPQILSDTNDTRMNFMEWVADEFQQNVLFAKTLCWQDGGLTGMVNNTVVKNGNSRGVVCSPDAAYWVVNQLLMSDEVNGDPEAQEMVREIIKRYATLEVNSDGQWYHWYNRDSGDLHAWEYNDGPVPTTSIFSTMKGVHMAIRAKSYYPGDSEIVEAANAIIGRLRNQRDYIREFGKQKSPADNLGPVPDSVSTGIFSPYIETHLFSELMAASEPMCENAYLDYWRYRDNHTVDHTLPDEPIIKTKIAGFWRMYDQSTIAHCRESAAWKQDFRNFYALFAGWTDDNAPGHLTAFSAGSTPDGYSSDKYTVHPGTVNSFGTVIGFGLHGDTVPVVGAYFAYRDGQRQLMEGSANYADPDLLTRISYEDPDWILSSISPTDHQYAGYALGELLAPGAVDRAIAVHTYREPEYDGSQVLFSKTVKRHIHGTTNGTDWVSLGFHYSPYTPPAGAPYTGYRVTGAEGELLEPVSNQTYDVSNDFDGTLYIVRAVSTNTGPLRVQWYNGTSFISEDTGFQALETVKPAGATELRADLSGDSYEQISVVLDGMPETFSNAGFESGTFADWTSTQQTGLTRANVADSRMEGSRACEFTATVGAANGNYVQVYHEYDISGDPPNTHYVVEFDAITENLEGSSLRARLKIFDATNNVIRAEYYDTFENANTQTTLSAGFRKRDANHVKLRFIMRLTRDDASAVTAEERVLVDNLRLLKMKP